MSNWVRICATDEVPPGEAREFVVEDRIIALFHVDDQFYALDGICPHQGGPLGKGELRGCVITCPWHGWQFDVRDGQHCTIPSLAQATLTVRVDGNDVLVDLDP